MAVPTDALELANDLIDCGMPREHAEVLAAKLSEKFGLAASEEDLDRRLASERELSDARFEALLERIDARFDRAKAEMDARFAQVDARFDQMDARLDQMDARFDQAQSETNARFEQAQSETNARFELYDARQYARFAEFEVKVYRAVAIGTGLVLAAISIWGAFG